LGLGHTNNVFTPTEVKGNLTAIEIATGFYHSFIITVNGSAFGFGKNSVGQLGTGTFTNLWIPTPCLENTNVAKISLGFEFSIMLKTNGSIYSFGLNVCFVSFTFQGCWKNRGWNIHQ
jgi:alpha-tubulin suppressor-like RCC1 family protein